MKATRTALYWQLVDRWMVQHQVSQRDAQLALLHHHIQAGLATGLGHNAIAERLRQRWGLCESAYYRGLAQLRQVVCVP